MICTWSIFVFALLNLANEWPRPPRCPCFQSFSFNSVNQCLSHCKQENPLYAEDCVCFWTSSIGWGNECTPSCDYSIHDVWKLIWCLCLCFVMSARDISGPFIPSARQTIYILVGTKLHFQAYLRRLFGEERLATINTSAAPFILPAKYYQHSFDKYVFILL